MLRRLVLYGIHLDREEPLMLALLNFRLRDYSIPVFLGLILRLIQIQSPILGVHSWRQADTAAMARHFALKGTPIWLPQIDWGGASDGFVECEFPLFPFLIGQLYKLTGIHEWVGRSTAVICSLITIILVIRIGTILLDPDSGWWGGLFFAILPLTVFYGRTFQAESMLLMFGALSIERYFAWRKTGSVWSLIFSWSSFTAACLIKVLPLIWLGIPILALHAENTKRHRQNGLLKLVLNVFNILKKPSVSIYFITAILIASIWFLYAYQIGQLTGLSFGFWGTSSDRSSLRLLLNTQIWLDFALRITLRNFAILGLPLAFLGFWKSRKDLGGFILMSGVIGWFASTLIAFRASSIHEYYQLPLMLFACPFMGRGFVICTTKISKSLIFSVPSQLWLILFNILISFTILNFDYWSLERTQEKIWMPLAERIRNEVPGDHRIVTVTGGDPTLLNLARRQGWLTSIENVNDSSLADWSSQGAKYLVGSFEWQESYAKLSGRTTKTKLEKLFCGEPKDCLNTIGSTYFLSLDNTSQ